MFQFLFQISVVRFTMRGLLVVLSTQSFFACKNSTAPVDPSRIIVMTTELIKDSSVYHFYDSLHSKEGVWPELKKANMASGIEEIRIYRYDNRLMMMLVLDDKADLSKVDSLYVNADQKIKVWGQMMSGFQRALPGVDSSRKWIEMKLIHHYKNGEYYK